MKAADHNTKKAGLWQRGLITYCVVLFLISLGLLWVEYTGEEGESISLSQYATSDATQEPYLIQINTATEEQLQSLPNVGPVLAKSIISYRDQQGPFRSFEELLHVRGIGEKTLEALLPLISLD